MNTYKALGIMVFSSLSCLGMSRSIPSSNEIKAQKLFFEKIKKLQNTVELKPEGIFNKYIQHLATQVTKHIHEGTLSHFRTMIKEDSYGLLELDEQGTILYINPNSAAIETPLGYTTKEGIPIIYRNSLWQLDPACLSGFIGLCLQGCIITSKGGKPFKVFDPNSTRKLVLAHYKVQ